MASSKVLCRFFAYAFLGLFCCLDGSACLNFGGIDLAPSYSVDKFIVPANWQGSSPFVQAEPADAMIRKNWWELFEDSVLNTLEEEAMAANPDLQAAAERFLQARDEMMKARSQLLPNLGLGVDLSTNQQSAHGLFMTPSTPLRDSGLSLGGAASWEPDFWSELRNSVRLQIYRAEQEAAQYALARLSIQAELATAYFTLRGLDAQEAVYRQSTEYYEKSLALVMLKFKGFLASELDVARAQYQLSSTQARKLRVQAKRCLAEHAIAILVNRAPASFRLKAVDHLDVISFEVPASLPSTLLQRRPDVAAMERQMAQANRGIGIARAAFFPNISLGGNGGLAGHFLGLWSVPNFFWSVASFIRLPIFEGGYRRAQLQKAWSAYRETENRYRATILNAFREVEDGLSLTQLITTEVLRQNTAMAAAWKQQDLSMELYKGALASSFELINAQVNTLESRITLVEVKVDLLSAIVGLVRALGGGWSHEDMPGDNSIQPFGVLQYSALAKPEPAAGIDVHTTDDHHDKDLTKTIER